MNDDRAPAAHADAGDRRRGAIVPTIRLVGPADSIDELTLLLHRAYLRLLEMGMRYTATYQDAALTRSRLAGGECYVAVYQGRLVGTILFREDQATDGCPYYERPGVASFHQFGVDPDFRGLGIGARLLDRVEERAAQSGAAELALDTADRATHLIAMYERRGYRVVDTHDWEETNYPSVIMSKRVGAEAGAVDGHTGRQDHGS